MATRYTASDLKQDIKEINATLKNGYQFEYEHRNGYHAVDLNLFGKCMACVECAEPPRKLLKKVLSELEHVKTLEPYKLYKDKFTGRVYEVKTTLRGRKRVTQFVGGMAFGEPRLVSQKDLKMMLSNCEAW